MLTGNIISRIELRNHSNEPVLIEDFQFDGFSAGVTIVEDLTGNIWIALQRTGLLRYNPETKKPQHFKKYGTHYGPASPKCSALALDKKGNLWVGTLDKGLSFIESGDLHKEEIIFETIQRDPLNNQSLNSNLIYSLYVSEDNLLWIGTIGSGVNIFGPDQKKFKHYTFRDLTNKSPNSNFIRSVFTDKQNRI